jgi:hypothetical protein
MSYIDTTPPTRSGIYPALLTGQQPSTVLTSFQRTDRLESQTIFAYVSSFNQNQPTSAPKYQFRSYDDYIAYKKATFANRAT